MNAMAFHAARSSGRRVQSGRRVAPYLVTLGIEDDYPEVGKRGGRYKVVNGKKVYAPKGGGGGQKAAVTPAPKAPSNSQQVRADGTGGPPGPNRKPTPEERVASARAKARLPPPFKGTAAVKRGAEDLETFLSSAPANREKMVGEYVQAFQDMALSGGPDATATVMRSLGIRAERETLTNAEIARQVTPEKVAGFLRAMTEEYGAMRGQVRKAYEGERAEVESLKHAYRRPDSVAFREEEKRVRDETTRKVKKLMSGWQEDPNRVGLFEQILKFKQ